jgi:hypothetical protein
VAKLVSQATKEGVQITQSFPLLIKSLTAGRVSSGQVASMESAMATSPPCIHGYDDDDDDDGDAIVLLFFFFLPQ